VSTISPSLSNLESPQGRDFGGSPLQITTLVRVVFFASVGAVVVSASMFLMAAPLQS